MSALCRMAHTNALLDSFEKSAKKTLSNMLQNSMPYCGSRMILVTTRMQVEAKSGQA